MDLAHVRDGAVHTVGRLTNEDPVLACAAVELLFDDFLVFRCRLDGGFGIDLSGLFEATRGAVVDSAGIHLGVRNGLRCNCDGGNHNEKRENAPSTSSSHLCSFPPNSRYP